MSTYLVAFVVSDYVNITSETSRGIKVSLNRFHLNVIKPKPK